MALFQSTDPWGPVRDANSQPKSEREPEGLLGGDRTRDLHVSDRARLHVATTADVRYMVLGPHHPLIRRTLLDACVGLIKNMK